MHVIFALCIAPVGLQAASRGFLFYYSALSGLGSVLGTASQGYHPMLKDNALSGLHLSLRSPRSPEKTG